MRYFYSLFVALSLFIPAHGQLFTDQISGSGISAAGVRLREIIDYDNDGYEDLLIFNNNSSTGLRLYRNNHDFTFTDVTVSAGLPVIQDAYAIAMDVDNNGFSDLLVISGNDSIRIFMNYNGVFTEKTTAYGITNPVVPAGGSITYPIPIDIDRDGDLDLLFLRNTNNGSTQSISALINEVNNCNSSNFNTFIDKIDSLPISTSVTPILIDYDNDQQGDLILLMGNNNGSLGIYYHYQPISLYHNNNGNFTDVTAGSGLTTANPAGFATVWDYDNDGWLDIATGTSDYNADGQQLECKVFKNKGNGTFSDVTSIVVLRNSDNYYFNATTIDFDNDGDFDVYWYNHGFNTEYGNELYVNSGGVFTENGAAYGLNLVSGINGSGAHQGPSPSWFDANNDGALDMFASSEVFPNYNSPGFFMKNNLNTDTNRYIDIKLNGCESGKDARGLRVQVVTAAKKLTQFSGARIGGSQALVVDLDVYEPMSHRFHFGLDTAFTTDSVIVYWPSGIITRLANVASNQILTVSEDATCPAINSSFPIIITGDTSLCTGQSVSLTASVNGGATGFTFKWSPATGLSDTLGATVTASPDSSTNYVITITSQSGCTASDSFTLPVIPKAIAGIINVTPDTVCEGETARLSLTGNVGLIQWQSSLTGGSYANLSNTDSSFYATPPLSQTTSYRVIASNAYCTDTSHAIILIVNPLPVTPGVFAIDTLICSNDSARLQAIGSYTSYLWNNGVTDSFTYVNAAGNYRVSVNDANGCTAVSDNQNISVYPVSSVSIDVNGDTLSSFNSRSYQWILDGIQIQGATGSVYVARQSGNYSVQVTDSNGCNAISNSVPITVDGIREPGSNQDIEVYPNPVSVEVFITIKNDVIVDQIRIVDMLGQQVKQAVVHPFQGECLTIDVSDLPPGSYILLLYNNLRPVSQKLLTK